MNDTIIKVRDIPSDAVLIQDSQDKQALAESTGIDVDEYGCLFATVGDGEYVDVWGVSRYIPLNDAAAYPLLVNGEKVE